MEIKDNAGVMRSPGCKVKCDSRIRTEPKEKHDTESHKHDGEHCV